MEHGAPTMSGGGGGDDDYDGCATAVEVAELATVTMADSNFAHKTLQDYEVLSVMGNGCFGTCYKVRDKASGALYVWKGVDYDDDELDGEARAALAREIAALRQLQHPNIVQYHHHLVNAAAKCVFLVMECCAGGDLAQLIARARAQRRRLEERYVWRVLLQLSRALQLCHTRLRAGTLLHRDIKPANIFLDADGNAKLGDFGLARLLRRSDGHFARTVVGTPYYMSPELVRGARYDRTADVWALGCLVFELCALRPPFRGRDGAQLSLSIAAGQCGRVPAAYSADLQAIIDCMLTPEQAQRPGIEVIARHPLLVRNVSDLGGGYPTLVDIGPDEFGVESGAGGGGSTRCTLQYSPMRDDTRSVCSLEGHRRLSVGDVFTPDLRDELFYSAKRRVFSSRSTLQRSDPELYESVRREGERMGQRTQPDTTALHPAQLTRSIFDEALQTRLHSIRVQESLLQQRELNLDARELQLVEWEKRLQEKERELLLAHAKAAAMCRPKPVEPSLPPPVPPRKPSGGHDDTYCSIEPNDTLLQPPTVAKLNLAALPAPKAFPAARRVTFQSPKKFISYDIENLPPPASATTATKRVAKQSGLHHLHGSVSSNSSNESADTASTQRRKSLLSSIFGLHRSAKGGPAQRNAQKPTAAVAAPPTTTAAPIIANCQTAELSSMWTKEHKRAAFDLLAAMNAAERCGGSGVEPASRHKLRQSVRERNLQRSRLRRSMVAMPTSTQVATKQRAASIADHAVLV